MVETFLHLFIESLSTSHFLVMLYAYKCCKNELLKLPPAFNSIMLKNILWFSLSQVCVSKVGKSGHSVSMDGHTIFNQISHLTVPSSRVCLS